MVYGHGEYSEISSIYSLFSSEEVMVASPTEDEGLYHTQPRPLLNSDKEINQITVTYESPIKNESQAIYNFDKAALIKYLGSCEIKWLHSESVLSSGDYEFCITIEESDGVSSDFLFIFGGELNIVETSNNGTVNNVYEISNGHDVLDKVRELMGVEAKNFN